MIITEVINRPGITIIHIDPVFPTDRTRYEINYERIFPKRINKDEMALGK